MKIKLANDIQVGDRIYKKGNYIKLTTKITKSTIDRKVKYDIEVSENLLKEFEKQLGELKVINDWSEKVSNPIGLPIMQKVVSWLPKDQVLKSILNKKDSSGFTILFWFYIPSEDKATEQSVIEGSILLAEYYLEGVFNKKLWTEYFDLSGTDCNSLITTALGNFKDTLNLELGN